jgi:hypothetical protein
MGDAKYLNRRFMIVPQTELALRGSGVLRGSLEKVLRFVFLAPTQILILANVL